MTPSDVRQAFEALDIHTRARCLALLCRPCLDRVHAYFAEPGSRQYRDSLVGLRHVVDVDLPARALAAIRAANGVPSRAAIDALLAEYQEPITAHQDDDLTIADAGAEYGYLAIYNLVRSCKDPDDRAAAWLVVRQALSATGVEASSDVDVEGVLSHWAASWPSA